MTFDEIIDLVPGRLPPSAYEHDASTEAARPTAKSLVDHRMTFPSQAATHDEFDQGGIHTYCRSVNVLL